MAQPPRAVALVFEYFGGLRDRRIDRRKFHELPHVIVMALCGMIAGADGWETLAAFAKAKEEWFRTFLDLKRGTPSADTFRRVFSRLDPRAFEACLRQWVQAVAGSLKGEVVAIDGKALRGAIDHAGSTTPLQMLHVWATEQCLLLAQRGVNGAPGEVGAIPELLRLLDLKGATVTLDANGCTPVITEAIRERGADYVIPVKGNRAALKNYIAGVFESASQRSYRGTRASRTRGRGHGRREKRVLHVTELNDLPSELAAKWKGLRTAVRMERTRTVNGESSTEVHFYVSSLPPEPEQIAHAIRAHWGIENGLHWTLDVAFAEDRQRIRDRIAAENLAVVTRLALMLLKSEKSQKASIAMKRRMAAWKDSYLATILTSGISIS